MKASPDTSAAAEATADWGHLPPELLRLVFRYLRAMLSPGVTLKEAARVWVAAANQCRPWRAVVLEELAFHVRLEEHDWGNRHLAACLAAVPVNELSLPPPSASAAAALPPRINLAWLFTPDFEHTFMALLTSPDLLGRRGGMLRVLHSVPLRAVLEHGLQGWTALQQLDIAPDSLPHGGGRNVPDVPPGALPPSLRQISLPVPRHPFHPASLRAAAGLEHITLRCDQDFILTRSMLGGGTDAQGLPWMGRLSPRWQDLTVHAGRTIGLDLDDLRLLPPMLPPMLPPPEHTKAGPHQQPSGSSSGAVSGSIRSGTAAAAAAAAPSLSGPTPLPVGHSITLVAPQVMLSTSDPACPALLAAPPVRSLEATLGQHLAATAPVLAAAGVTRLCLVAGEASFYCRRPGRLGIVDAGALPPAGHVQAKGRVEGYMAVLAWPAATAVTEVCGGSRAAAAAAAAEQGGGAPGGSQASAFFEICFSCTEAA